MVTERIIPPTIEADGSVSYYSVFSPPDDSIAVCYVIAHRVIPVIFVPGIMGSNLQDSKAKPIWVVNDAAEMSGWASKDALSRKNMLDPTKTNVFDGGELPKGTSLSDEEKKARGWGTVSKMSYGDWLVWLEDTLNDCHECTEYGKKGLRAQLMKQVIAPELETLTHDEVSLSYRYRLPVHAFGYNWLQSNADAAEALGEEIDRIIAHYRLFAPCESVILVTHSMGGLVARHCSEVRGYSDRILGIVHGVMPATGAATAYKRVKAGTESSGGIMSNVTAHVLGATAKEITAVFAQSPGALQLLPSTDYGFDWLKIRDGSRVVALPKRRDPYAEIYTQRGQWWGLIDDQILNPLDVDKRTVEQDWERYAELINRSVRKFHEAISRRYHAHTYVFYGDDEKRKTWGDVEWKRTGFKPNFLGRDAPPLNDALALKPGWDSYTGTQRVAHEPDRIEEFVLQDPTESGDGTVPARSGRAPEPFVKKCIAFSGIDHESAYKPVPSPQPPQLFTLWAITRLIGNVKGTPMEYTE